MAHPTTKTTNIPMKKTIITVLTAIISLSLSAQSTYFTKTGKIDFFSSTPIENIEAVNNDVSSFLNVEKNELVFAVLIKSFRFEKALMQEHFNENYMESDKFPKAQFKGNIQDFDQNNYKKDGEYTVNVKGDLTMHGVTKNITVPGTILVKNGKISALSKFKVRCADYEIKIPSVVSNKISEEIDVNVDIKYEPYEKKS
jgi:hypothetical protein